MPSALRAIKKRNSDCRVSQLLCDILYASSFAGSAIEETARILFEEGQKINSSINRAEIAPRLRSHLFTWTGEACVTPLQLLLEWNRPTGKHQDICDLRLRMLHLLVDAGSDVNKASGTSRDKGGWTPLQLACFSGGCLEEVKCLVEANTKINAPVSTTIWCGRTALRAAVDEDNLDVVEYLIVEALI